jgi:hypothetical protein
MNTKPCPICRENHEPDRRLSFDGKGINSCGMYRNRIATFGNNDQAQLLGPVFAAAPELLKQARIALRYLQESEMIVNRMGTPYPNGLEDAITLATGKDRT